MKRAVLCWKKWYRGRGKEGGGKEGGERGRGKGEGGGGREQGSICCTNTNSHSLFFAVTLRAI